MRDYLLKNNSILNRVEKNDTNNWETMIAKAIPQALIE